MEDTSYIHDLDKVIFEHLKNVRDGRVFVWERVLRQHQESVKALDMFVPCDYHSLLFLLDALLNEMKKYFELSNLNKDNGRNQDRIGLAKNLLYICEGKESNIKPDQNYNIKRRIELYEKLGKAVPKPYVNTRNIDRFIPDGDVRRKDKKTIKAELRREKARRLFFKVLCYNYQDWRD